MIELVPAAMLHAELLAGMHAICFVESWSARSMAEVLVMPGSSALIAVDGGQLQPSTTPPGPAGLVMWRRTFDEAEILTLAVLPPWRCQGVGGRLLEAAMADSAAQGAATMFLEVADDNLAGQALYRRHGFAQVGRRKGYYGGVDALTMRRTLDQSQFRELSSEYPGKTT
ncbi:GNAT family N-acetyltransferase [Magnetospirillum molischianum]|uniref:Acetyltransferases n=1 Tax=Magnetospirillum molischianum DSM 120 TaxID=1150626 RepID=H8FT80_MAGML|nr:GNAT family N-acetyltransferase [Magnetospirillum molischianum]CCG41568.1 Acetyltransferases [Magnetospirillum molischianum DSM 120]